jgi:hypothetical protein
MTSRLVAVGFVLSLVLAGLNLMALAVGANATPWWIVAAPAVATLTIAGVIYGSYGYINWRARA